MNILLVCSAGMSTSLVVEKMKKALTPEEASWKIEAVALDAFESSVKDYDVVLLGPQVRFKKAEFAKVTEPLGIPIDVINMSDYGLVRGDKILEAARQLYKNKK